MSSMTHQNPMVFVVLTYIFPDERRDLKGLIAVYGIFKKEEEKCSNRMKL